MRYRASLSDGQWRDAGGSTTFTARSLRRARAIAEAWADAGEYPCAAPVSVLLILDAAGGEVARWSYRVADKACSEGGRS